MSDFTSLMGFGGGIGILVKKDDYKNYAIVLDLSIRKSRGGNATYLTKGDYYVDRNGDLIINEHSTRTDMVEYRLTLSSRF